MQLETLLNEIPEFAKDLRLNMGNVLRQPELTPIQAWGTAVACAAAVRNPRLIAAIEAEALPHLGEQGIFGARAAAAIMGMNNIFYRFRHLSNNPKYGEMPARLRMQVIGRHGANPVSFELWCLAVSSINGCGLCVDAHEKVLREKGAGEDVILAAVRIAAVIHALGAVVCSHEPAAVASPA
jgi:alkyl hydroperoxide reductase subunit D